MMRREMEHLSRECRRSLAVAFLATTVGCAGAGRNNDEGGDASITVGGATDTGGASTPGGNDESGDKLDVNRSDSSGVVDECAGISQESSIAMQPADILIVVDNSGSMDFESKAVQDYLNGFSQQIFAANIDAHVVLLSAYPGASDAGICIDAPLGGGMCPASDSNPPGFIHIDQLIESSDALTRLIERHADWATAMRPTASKHIIVVTDDNSDLSAADFMTMWSAIDPSYVPVFVHGIAAIQDPVTSCLDGNASGCCAIASVPGAVYQTLADQTAGVFGNLCTQEFQPIFDAVADQVIEGSDLACEFTIPPPPDGEEFDPKKVNVDFFQNANDADPTLEIGYVDDLAACAGVDGGWYYNDPAAPTTILLCSQTCDAIQGHSMAKIAIQFGCATVPAG